MPRRHFGKSLILNRKNVETALLTGFQDRTDWFDLHFFVIGNGSGADPFRGGPGDAISDVDTPLDGQDFEKLECLE